MKTDLERLKQFRKILKLSQEDFGKPLGSKQSSISDAERGKVGISSDLLRGLILIYRLNPFWLFFGKPPMQISESDLSSLSAESGYQTSVLSMEELSDEGGMIPLSSSNLVISADLQNDYVQAAKTGKWDAERMSYASYAKIPGISGEVRTFQLTGDSMTPAFMHGDYVCCKALDGLKLAREGGIYLLVSQQYGILLARIERHERKQSLKLHFENKQSGGSLDLPYKDLLEIWEIQMRLTAVIHSPYEPRLKALEDKLRLLE